MYRVRGGRRCSTACVPGQQLLDPTLLQRRANVRSVACMSAAYLHTSNAADPPIERISLRQDALHGRKHDLDVRLAGSARPPLFAQACLRPPEEPGHRRGGAQRVFRCEPCHDGPPSCRWVIGAFKQIHDAGTAEPCGHPRRQQLQCHVDVRISSSGDNGLLTLLLPYPPIHPDGAQCRCLPWLLLFQHQQFLEVPAITRQRCSRSL
jgi:hypothetical protein